MHKRSPARGYEGIAAGHGGFAYVAVVLVVAVALATAAVVVPNVISSVDRARIEDARDRLEVLERAIRSFGAHQNQGGIGIYPGTLAQLTRRIGEPGDVDLCGGTYNNAQIDRWDLPYFPRLANGDGHLPGTIGEIQGPLERNPPAGNPARLNILVNFVHELDAIALGRMVDGDENPATGTVRWTSPDGEGLVTLRWGWDITGCSA